MHRGRTHILNTVTEAGRHRKLRQPIRTRTCDQPGLRFEFCRSGWLEANPVAGVGFSLFRGCDRTFVRRPRFCNFSHILSPSRIFRGERSCLSVIFNLCAQPCILAAGFLHIEVGRDSSPAPACHMCRVVVRQSEILQRSFGV